MPHFTPTNNLPHFKASNLRYLIAPLDYAMLLPSFSCFLFSAAPFFPFSPHYASAVMSFANSFRHFFYLSSLLGSDVLLSLHHPMKSTEKIHRKISDGKGCTTDEKYKRERETSSTQPPNALTPLPGIQSLGHRQGPFSYQNLPIPKPRAAVETSGLWMRRFASSTVQSFTEGMDINQMSAHLFVKHLLGPECMQRVKGHLAVRTKAKIKSRCPLSTCLSTPNSNPCYKAANKGLLCAWQCAECLPYAISLKPNL